jgi:hypothetical protein
MEKCKDISDKDNNPSMSNMDSCKSLLDNLAKHLMKIFYFLFVMNIGRVIMNKFNFLLIISCNILKSSQHMINLFNHFMTGINFL